MIAEICSWPAGFGDDSTKASGRSWRSARISSKAIVWRFDAYAVRVSDLVWRLDAGKLLSATEEGRSVEETREFLSTHSGAPLPDTVLRLLDDVANRCARAHDRGLARLIECDEGTLVALIANDARTRKHCMRAGERNLVVPAASEAAFRRALREVGYLLAAATPHGAEARRAKASQGSSAPAGET